MPPVSHPRVATRLERAPVLLALLGASLLVPARLAAQEPPRAVVPAPRPAVPDTVAPLVGPLPAFFRSLVLPGWGQAVLDRKLTAGLFLLWEGVTLGMTVKTGAEVRFLKSTEDSRLSEGATEESPLLRSKKAEREDWLVLLLFNHLFSGLEAYVSAHLWDFPGDLHVQALPGAGAPRTGVGIRFPLGRP